MKFFPRSLRASLSALDFRSKQLSSSYDTYGAGVDGLVVMTWAFHAEDLRSKPTTRVRIPVDACFNGLNLFSNF